MTKNGTDQVWAEKQSWRWLLYLERGNVVAGCAGLRTTAVLASRDKMEYCIRTFALAYMKILIENASSSKLPALICHIWEQLVDLYIFSKGEGEKRSKPLDPRARYGLWIKKITELFNCNTVNRDRNRVYMQCSAFSLVFCQQNLMVCTEINTTIFTLDISE